MLKFFDVLKFLVLVCLFVFICDEANADVFDTLRRKTNNFVIGLRTLAYVISCFGMVMFTFLAITGKINFKHLGFIFISLSMLSATGAIIDYFSGSSIKLETEFNDTHTNFVCMSSLCES